MPSARRDYSLSRVNRSRSEMPAKLKPLLDTLEGLDATVAALYEPVDGKFRLSVEGLVDEAEHRAELKRLNADAMNRRKELEALKKTLPQDFDPDEWTRLREDAAKRAEEDLARKGEWDSLKRQMEERHQAEIAKLTKERDEAISETERYLLDEAATREIASADGIPEILLPYIKTRTRVVKDGGKRHVIVLDGDGNPMIGDAKGTPMTLAQFVADLKKHETFGATFKAARSGGGGSQQGSSGGGAQRVITDADFQALSPEERLKRHYEGKTPAVRAVK